MSQYGGAGPGAEPVEEELSAGARRSLPRWVLPVVVVVALVVAGIVLLVRAGGSDRSVVRAEPSTEPSTVAPASTGEGGSVGPRISDMPFTPEPARSGIVVVCPATSTCRLRTELPPVVLRTLRTYYPRARVTDSVTTTAGRGREQVLVRRTISAVADRRKIMIVLTPYVLGPDDFDRRTRGRLSTVTVRGTTYGGARSGASVQLTLVEPATESPNDIVVLRLARDPRLAALR